MTDTPDPTPSLTEFRRAYESDRNAWWWLDSGDQLNLFDAALEALDDADREIRRREREAFIAGFGFDDVHAIRRYEEWREERAWSPLHPEIGEVRP